MSFDLVSCIVGVIVGWFAHRAAKFLTGKQALPVASRAKKLTLEDEVWMELTDSYLKREEIADRLIARGVKDVTDLKLWRVLNDMVDRFQVEKDPLDSRYRLRLKGGSLATDASKSKGA
jgi:hypothetical protein